MTAAAITTRAFTPEDLPTLEKWWTDHGWPHPPNPALLTRGLITDHAAIFLFIDPLVPVVGILFIVTNPANTTMETQEALSILLDGAELYARELKKSGMFSMVEKSSLGNFLTAEGWMNAGQHYNYLKIWDSPLPHCH